MARQAALTCARDTRALSVTEIGLRLGFDETSSFTTTFRKLTGFTPSRYHRRIAHLRDGQPLHAPEAGEAVDVGATMMWRTARAIIASQQ
jgi:AraC-like DNA-binding protein